MEKKNGFHSASLHPRALPLTKMSICTHICSKLFPILGFPGGASGKESTCQCSRQKRLRFDPWVGKMPWRRAWQPTPVFLPGESHGQRSLAGYSPWGHRESDMTEVAEHARTCGLWWVWLWSSIIYTVTACCVCLSMGSSHKRSFCSTESLDKC